MTEKVNGSFKLMKCLSLKQPYADLLVEGIKTIELRKWKTKFRGTFLVHASKVPFESSYDKSRLGCIVGMATLVDVKHYDNEKAWQSDIPLHRADDDFIESHYGFVIVNPTKFEKPIPFAGSLNFFNVLFNEETLIAKQFMPEKLS